MRKTKVINETVQITKTVELICNKCGKTVKLDKDAWQKQESIQHFEIHFGFGSRFDMERWEFDLCEDCIEKIVKPFKYKPTRSSE